MPQLGLMTIGEPTPLGTFSPLNTAAVSLLHLVAAAIAVPLLRGALRA